MAKKKPEDFQPDDDFPEDHFHHGKPRCNAWSYNQERQCMGIAMENGKCRVHGGSQNKGIEHHNYKHGRTSRYTPKIPSRYPEYLDDPNYLALVDEIALVTSRIDELYNQIDIGESARLWREAQKEFSKLRKAIAESDAEKLTDAINALDVLLLSGNAAWAKWGEIDRMVETRRKLTDTERKRVEAAQQSLRADKAIQIYQSMVLANREAIKQIENEIYPDDIEIRDGQIFISTKAKNRILERIGSNFRTHIDRSNIVSVE